MLKELGSQEMSQVCIHAFFPQKECSFQGVTEKLNRIFVSLRGLEG
jgi:hypothetical protein